MSFTFKPFQLQDLARAALHDGLILGQDTGLGKTIALYVWPCLKLGFDKVGTTSTSSHSRSSLQPNGAVLLVVPGDGHDQTSDEGHLHFKVRPIRLDSQAAFLRLSTLDARGRRKLPHGFYLTSYTQLADNGIASLPKLHEATMKDLHLAEPDVAQFFEHRSQHYREDYDTLRSNASDPLAAIRARYFRLRKEYFGNDAITSTLDRAFEILEQLTAPSFAALTPGQLKFLRAELLACRHREYSAGIGETRRYSVLNPQPSTFQVKCVYSPSLADLSQDAFDCVCVDEGTKIKGETTIIGRGVRQMNPRFRLITTATPIKNRLPDIFRLAWWVVGAHEEPSPRFPYGNDSTQRDDFAEEFLVSERNLSAEARAELTGGGRPRTKLTPQVCNVHRLWKLFAPIVLRRRKQDCGEQIVSKVRHVIRVPMGARQSKVYKYHLEAKYRDRNGLPAIGAKLQALRIAAANPASALLDFVPAGRDDFHVVPFRSPSCYTPKLAGVLNLIQQMLTAREQVIVGGAFHDSLDPIGARLAEAGVPFLSLDGRITQTKRARLAKLFKAGPVGTTSTSSPSYRLTSSATTYPVCLAGVESMAELHSFNLCRNAILLAYSWAWDKFEQFINRIHRLNSPEDVHVWCIFCDGTIDRKLEGLIQEKGDACELVLDGKLIGENSAEVNLADLLHSANLEFNPANRLQTIDECALEKDWPALRANLADAWRHWRSVPTSLILPGNTSTSAAPIPLPGPRDADNAPAPNNSARKHVHKLVVDDLPLWQQSARPAAPLKAAA